MKRLRDRAHEGRDHLPRSNKKARYGFQNAQTNVRGHTYDVTVTIRTDGPGQCVYGVSVQSDGFLRGKRIVGKELYARDLKVTCAEARNQVTLQTDALGPERK